MSYSYPFLVIVYAAAAIFLAYTLEEELESLAGIIALLIALVVLVVCVNELWGQR